MTENKSRFVLLCQQALACAVVVTLAAPAAGIGSLDLVAPSTGARASGQPGQSGPVGSLVAAEPVTPTVTEVPLTGPDRTGHDDDRLTTNSRPLPIGEVEADEEALGSVETPKAAGLSDPQPVDGFATVGVTWSSEQHLADDEITVSVRSLADGAWSRWQVIPYDAAHGPAAGSPEAAHERMGTDAVVVGDVDDVQVKAVTSRPALPTDMSLDIVDPGDGGATARELPAIDTADLGPADVSATSAGTGEDPNDPVEPVTPVVPGDPGIGDDAELLGGGGVTPKPQIFSRAQWGADERMRDKGSLRYFEVRAGFVHHTVNANNYTRDQVPSILRGIYAYHTQSRGWSDVGYNFLVDRFGRIWEGRYGGVARPVVGAHTLDYNDYAFAMSAIGNFETTQPSAALLDAYGRLFAWKLGLHGIDPAATSQRVGNRTLPAINGHRDVAQTACPGRYLYAKIPNIRTLASSYQRPFRSRKKDSDVSGTSWPDLVVRDHKTQVLSVVRTGGQVGFARGRVAGLGGRAVDLAVVSKDLTGDGRADALVRDRGTGVTQLLPGTAAGGFGASASAIKRFGGLDQLAAVGDFDGNGTNDLVGRPRASKRLVLVPGRGDGTFGRTRSLGDWSGYDLTSAAGDLDRDGHLDLLARDKAGKLWLVAGTGTGSLAGRTTLPGRWGGRDLVAGFGDVTLDGVPDVVARSRDSRQTYLYPGDGRGGLGPRLGPFSRFRSLRFLASPGQVTGSRQADLVGLGANGAMRVFAHRGTRNLAGVVPTGTSVSDTDLLLDVGDWNGDGRNDLMTRRASDGTMLFRAGTSGAGFADPVKAAGGWGAVENVTAVGDLTGDGFPDLMGQPRGGALRIYPGNHRHGFRMSYVAHGAVPSTAQVGVGLWDADGSPDSVIRRADGTLWLYPGNGPGGLTGSGTRIGDGAKKYDTLLGVGDVNGDGRADVVARQRSTGALWLLPRVAGGRIGDRRLIGTGFGRYDLIG